MEAHEEIQRALTKYRAAVKRNVGLLEDLERIAQQENPDADELMELGREVQTAQDKLSRAAAFVTMAAELLNAGQ